MKNISALPVDDIPKPLLDTMHFTANHNASQVDKEGYVNDPVAQDVNEDESLADDRVPCSTSGLVDVNGTNVTSDEINQYVREMFVPRNSKKLSVNGELWSDKRPNEDLVYIIRHSSKPANDILIQVY
ncbi:unnamed protein product [Didymodactylos carnosus]|uniref:Uncharacterized protein n=1 Tax=Didymodactylos carnosus TaxID=1234261 RepID=A0A814NUH8_9BILA|nr:unnamed protein product [Didymodactylos carnosus]CAF1098578.1 unnamed protein product [Didymodactylos carnosus]CAF3732273.1 unnamed protein product [Didymodactylos carnosus]CAF3863642.1 unnamed protein product [Didymodactylos carnosus]